MPESGVIPVKHFNLSIDQFTPSMPSTMIPAPFLRSYAFRSRQPSVSLRPIIGIKRPATYRGHADTNRPDKLPEAPQGELGPNTQQQEHVTEEAAKMAKIQGQEGPDLDQGTPVQEILQEEKETRKQAPEVLKEQVKKGDTGATTQASTDPGGKRSFSTLARRRMELQTTTIEGPPMDPLMIPTSNPIKVSESGGLKFTRPPKLHPKANIKKRHEEIVMQLTNLMMRDGKKATAEKNMQHILTTLRTAPAPNYAPTRPLLPGAPPASHLPLNPVLYLTLAVDSVAPVLRIRSQRGAAGGGVALQIPVPLGLRQRRRQSFEWILDASQRRGDRLPFAERVAQEMIAVVEGRSSVWERRVQVHRLGTTARTSLNIRSGFRR